jgi:hypothetical protein
MSCLTAGGTALDDISLEFLAQEPNKRSKGTLLALKKPNFPFSLGFGQGGMKPARLERASKISLHAILFEFRTAGAINDINSYKVIHICLLANICYPRSPIIGQVSYYWTTHILVGNLTHSKIAETKALEPLKS